MQKKSRRTQIRCGKAGCFCSHSLADIASRLCVITHSLYAWIKRYGPDSEQYKATADALGEIRCLQKELTRVIEERDLLKGR